MTGTYISSQTCRFTILQSTQMIHGLSHRAPCANITKHGGTHATHIKHIYRPGIHMTKRTYALPDLCISIGLPLNTIFKRRTISILNRYKMEMVNHHEPQCPRSPLNSVPHVHNSYNIPYSQMA